MHNLWLFKLASYNIIAGVNQLDVEVEESHLGKVADSMTEWEGPIADRLKLKPGDIANIKMAYPKELNLQTWVFLERTTHRLILP